MNHEIISSNRDDYDFASPIDLKSLNGIDPLLDVLVATQAFQRLQTIRFLGGQDYLFVRWPNGTKERYTRFQHSLGVARLALFYANAQELDLTSRRAIFVAALLHDIGHAPLSHSLEPAFREHFGIDHHRATEAIIVGRTPFGDEISNILRSYKVDVEYVVSLLAGNEDDFDGFFSGPINFDTIEGILRSQRYINPAAIPPNPESVVLSAARRTNNVDKQNVDDFWFRKDQVYKLLINSEAGVLADYVCRVYMEANLKNISADDYYSTEIQMFKKLRGLKELLTHKNFSRLARRHITGSLEYQARRFAVSPESDFFDRKDQLRYTQHKEKKHIHPCTDSLQDTEIFLLEYMHAHNGT